MIKANENWNSFKIMIIKEFPCNSKTELLIEEKELLKELLKKRRVNNKIICICGCKIRYDSRFRHEKQKSI